MQINEYIGELLVAGTGILTTITAWKQGQKNAQTSELDNVAKAISIWQDTAESLNKKLDLVDNELSIMKSNHEECERSKRELSEKVRLLEETMHNIIDTPRDKRKPLNDK